MPIIAISREDTDNDDVIINPRYFILGEKCWTSCSSYRYRYGIANPQGGIIVPAEYDYITQVDDDRIVTKGPINVYDISGRLIFDKYPGIHDFEILEDGRYKIAIYSETFPQKLQYGIYTRNGEEVLPCQYTYIYPFKDGFARFLKDGEIRKEQYSYGKYRRRFVGGAMGVLDINGRVIVEANYDYIRPFVKNVSIVTKLLPGNILRWGAINESGEEILLPEYSYLKNVGNDLLAFAKGGEWEYVIFSARDYYENHCKNNLLNAQWGIFDLKSKTVIIEGLDSVGSVHENKICYKLNGLYGYIRLDAGICIKAEYDRIGYFSSGLCPVAKKQDDGLIKFGYINSSNQLVIPFKYDSASVFQDNRAQVKDNGIVFTIDLNGNILSSYIKEDYYEDNEDDGWSGYTPEELEEMYREAMGANSTNEWNID